MDKEEARLLRELELHVEAAASLIRQIRGEQAEAPAHRPRTGPELLAALGISEADKKKPPYSHMRHWLWRYGPTHKLELVRLFADALESAYTTRGRAIDSMAQAININAGKANANAIAVGVRGGKYVQVPYIPQQPFKPRSLPEPMLLERDSEPNQYIALPDQDGKPESIRVP